MAETEHDVIVIGAGLSGTAAAYRLKKRCPGIVTVVPNTLMRIQFNDADP
jgi:cation diffusion facilitator CzcD-associated flavoprotein CzcO